MKKRLRSVQDDDVSMVQDDEIIMDKANNLEDLDKCMSKHVMNVFNEYKLIRALDQNMKYIKYDNDINVMHIVESCYEQYWGKSCWIGCPMVAYYFDNEWIGYDIEKNMEEIVHKILSTEYL